MTRIGLLREKAYALATDRRIALGACVVVGMIGTIQKYWSGHLSNYVIFKTSALNLLHLKDIYGPRYDTYHYTPTFAFTMIPFAPLPDWLGAILWNLLNFIPLLSAINRLAIPDAKRALVCWIILWELLTSLQNFQSNGLLAGLFLWTFLALERGRSFWAACFIMVSAFIKVFGLAAALLVPFYPRKLRASLALLFWFLALALLPGLAVPFSHLADLYRSWFHQLTMVHQHSYGNSVMGILHAWFGLDLPTLWVQLAGAALLCLPLLRRGRYPLPGFKHLFLASLMIWVVLFNHKAESPTYIIAMVGVALWFGLQQGDGLNRGLLVLALVFTSFYPDLLPRHVRESYMTPYAVKAIPCLLIWLNIQRELWSGDHGVGTRANHGQKAPEGRT